MLLYQCLQSQSVSSGYNMGRKRNRGREIRMIILACLVFGVAVTTALIVDIYTGSHHTGTRSFHFYFAQISLFFFSCSLSTIIAKHCSDTDFLC